MTIPSTFPKSLDQACLDFIRKECPKLPLSPSTITKYRYNLNGFLAFCREQVPPVLAPEQLTRKLFEKYNEYLQGQAKEQKDSIKKRFTTLRVLCRFLHQEGRIPEDFLLDFHPGQPPGPQAWQEPLPSPYWHHCQEFLRYCRSNRRLSDHTLRAYRNDLRCFSLYLEASGIQSPDISHISKETLEGYLDHMVNRLKKKTIRRHFACLMAFTSYLEYEELLDKNPFDRFRLKLRDPQRRPVSLSLPEMELLLQAAYSRKGRSSIEEKGIIRDIAVMELLFACGIRVSELCGLTFQDYDREEHSLLIHGKGSRDRVLFIPGEEPRQALDRYLDIRPGPRNPEDFIFLNKYGAPLEPHGVRNSVRHYVEQAALRRHVSPHTFRHTFASLLLEEGADIKYIQEFLGHSSILTTQIYLHTSDEKKREILKTRHPRNKMDVPIINFFLKTIN